MTHFSFVGTVFARISHTSPTNAATLVSMVLSGYTLHLTNRIAHSGPHGQTGAVYAGTARGMILLSKTAEAFLLGAAA